MIVIYIHTYNNNKLSVAWERYRKQRNQTVSLIRSAKKAYFDKINHDLSDPKISTKKWWSISKRLCGGNEVTSIPAIVEDGVTVSKTELRFRHVDTTELEIK